MQLCELPQGFHLIPIKDHCRTYNPKWRVAVSCSESISVQDGYYSFLPDWPRYRTKQVCSYRETLYFENYQAAKACAERLTEQGYYDKVKILPPRKRRETDEEKTERRSNAYFAKHCDPMAIQATMILRDVLRSIYNGDFDNGN